MYAHLSRRTWIIVVLVATLVWFANLDTRRLQHPDEGRYAEIAREMTVTGDWVTPRLDGLLYFEKPALQYWLTAASFEAFGVSEWTARLAPALLGWLAIFVVAYAGARIADVATGLYTGLVLASTLWYAGISHIVTLDAVLTAWMAIGLAAFLVAQSEERPRVERGWMLAAWTAIAAGVLTKGLVALVIPGGALVFYTLAARDLAIWRRLHLGAGVAIVLVLCVPWFLIVSLRNPEFAPFFFIHEHFQRFLTTEHRRTGAWWYFVPLLIVGLVPWVGVFFLRLPATWRDKATTTHSFAWQRFCVAWIAFVFLFFSASGSKLPSYILPLFPAAALIVGHQLARMPDPALRRLYALLAGTTVAFALAAWLGYERLVAALANAQTPASAFVEFEPWLNAGFALLALATVVASIVVRSTWPARRSVAVIAVALGMLGTLQLWLQGNDAFSVTRSSAALVQAFRQGPYDVHAPFFQVRMYDQTLPFYLGRTTTVVAYRDELALGLDAQPGLGVPTEREWIERWDNLPQAYAVMTPATYARLRSEVPMHELVRDPRRVLVARR